MPATPPEDDPRHRPAPEDTLVAADGTQATLRDLQRQQELFAHGISHELRAPLRAIETFATLLASHDGAALSDSGRDHLQRIRSAAARMGRLIEALLEYARVERAVPAAGTVDLSLLAEWAGAELQDAAPQRAAAIRVAPGLRVRGDEALLRIVLQQLLGNAWRFTPDDAPVHIDVDGRLEGEWLRIEVRDHGRGFDPRYVDKLFEPFQRLHAAEDGAGDGLGLAIARRIIERHGGRMHARSEPGGGSVFGFELPAAEAPMAQQA